MPFDLNRRTFSMDIAAIVSSIQASLRDAVDFGAWAAWTRSPRLPSSAALRRWVAERWMEGSPGLRTMGQRIQVHCVAERHPMIAMDFSPWDPVRNNPLRRGATLEYQKHFHQFRTRPVGTRENHPTRNTMGRTNPNLI
jgi:hypothetical protein